MRDVDVFRAHFPVLRERVYLNAGTEGPMPTAAAEAVQARIAHDLAHGRVGQAYFETVQGLAAELRAGYAQVLGARPEQVALTASTTDGCNTVLGGLRWRPGDEVLTSDQEHPGLLAPLRRLAVREGVRVRVAPFARIAEAAGPRTRLIACSHVSWVGGEVLDTAAVRATGVPVLLDGAQALGAIPVDVPALGVAYYAAPGQKWLCGPESSGCLYVRDDALDGLEPPWQGYNTVADHDDVLGSPLAPGVARLDIGFPAAVRSAWALAGLRVLEQAGWDWVHARAAALAARLADALAERGLAVAPRGPSTLVSWRPRAGAVEAEVARLAQAGVIVRSIPSAGLLRASVGAWCSETDLERLLSTFA